MKQKDIALALHALGLWIDRMERGGTSNETLIPFKHAYLRINWWILKNPSYSRRPALTKEELQVFWERRHSIAMTWLPCRKLLSESDPAPCNSQSKFCHCAQMLLLDLGEDVFS
jgi:hypothetical protein